MILPTNRLTDVHVQSSLLYSTSSLRYAIRSFECIFRQTTYKQMQNLVKINLEVEASHKRINAYERQTSSVNFWICSIKTKEDSFESKQFAANSFAVFFFTSHYKIDFPFSCRCRRHRHSNFDRFVSSYIFYFVCCLPPLTVKFPPKVKKKKKKKKKIIEGGETTAKTIEFSSDRFHVIISI